MARKNSTAPKSEQDEIYDFGFPREIEYTEDVPSMPDVWRKDLNDAIREFLEQNPDKKMLPNRADSYMIVRRVVRRRQKIFAVLTYMRNGPAGSTNTGWSAGSAPSENGHLTTLNDLPSEIAGDDYKNASNLDSFPSSD